MKSAAAALRHGRGDVGLQRQGVADDLALAGGADRRVGGVGLLHHGAEEAGVFGQLALEDLAAEVDVAEQALERVGERLVGGGGEEAGGHLAEMGGGGDAELLLGAEVVEEGALGDAGRLAELVDRGGGEALAADHVHGGVEQLGAGVLVGGHE